MLVYYSYIGIIFFGYVLCTPEIPNHGAAKLFEIYFWSIGYSV
jgi:hypothetical protein